MLAGGGTVPTYTLPRPALAREQFKIFSSALLDLTDIMRPSFRMVLASVLWPGIFVGRF
jgi:hypothetical protein